MNGELPKPPSFWRTVGLLLGSARQRAKGRRRRQQELLQQRSGRASTDWGSFGFVLAAFFMVLLNLWAAFIVKVAVESGQRLDVERQGKIIVSRSFWDAAQTAGEYYAEGDRYLAPFYSAEAQQIASDSGEGPVAVEGRLREAVRQRGVRDFTTAVTPDERMEAERQGKIVVSRQFYDAVYWAENYSYGRGEQYLEPHYSFEAKRISEDAGGNAVAVEKKLREEVRAHGTDNLVTRKQAAEGIAELPKSGRLAGMLGSLGLLWWGVMLVFQGEGLELDLQRRRHPMWEWLFSHPVSTGSVFLAEMLSPMAANPIYWGGPVFVGLLYGFVYDAGNGLLAALLIGVPVTIAAACLGKALEIAAVLRLPPRSRGAMIGLMSWLGYSAMMLLIVGFFVLPKIIAVLGKFVGVFTVVPWPWLRWFLGGRPDGTFSFAAGALTCWTVAGAILVGAVWFSAWGAQQGLAGNFAAVDTGPGRKEGGTRFGKEPLYRKEFLWFIRDRSAMVQTILIPVTVASLQVFNLRGLLVHAQGAWNYLCGVAILFGTYFLWILGPKSLTSEGTALWIALTWPRGLESLLKAKAWLWSLISSGLVLLMLGYAAFLYPAEIWKIGLAGVGWFFFSRSMAEKTVTLVTVTSPSGEAEKIPRGRRWAASLGMLTFAIGMLTQQWNLAVVGIVYSYMTAAAMWQNFRARLPFLYDPWSEKLPPPPTLMHAMIAISILVEGAAVVTGIVAAFLGRENLALALAMSYGICAVIVSIGVSNFLAERGVSWRDICFWPSATAMEQKSRTWWRADRLRVSNAALTLVVGAAAGAVLGLFAHGYLHVLQHIPATAELLRKSQEQMAKIPDFRRAFAVMAIGFAPFAEEYLFRGLVFRALDREWGGWRAVLGSAAFFAIYHPPLSWLPVALLGAANALIFKKTGWLAPAVALHMVYNAVVLT